MAGYSAETITRGYEYGNKNTLVYFSFQTLQVNKLL